MAGTSLTGLQIGSSYAGLIKTTDNLTLDGTLRRITDGAGVESALELSTAGVRSTGTLAAAGAVSGSNLSGTNTGDQTNITGNAATVTTNANMTGDVTSVGNATTYAGVVPIAKGGSGQSSALASRAALNKGETAITDAATIATDASAGNVFTVTLGGNRTMGAPTNLAAGATYIWKVRQSGSGSNTLGWNSVFKWPFGTAPVLTTTANAYDIISGVSDGTNIYCSFIQDVK